MATGTVVGMGNDPVHDNYLTIRYGKYEVKYGHISEAYVGYGTPVVAGQQVGKSGSFLHIGVLFEKIIGIHEGDKIPFRFFYPHVACMAQSTVRLMHHLHAVVFLSPLVTKAR